MHCATVRDVTMQYAEDLISQRRNISHLNSEIDLFVVNLIVVVLSISLLCIILAT